MTPTIEANWPIQKINIHLMSLASDCASFFSKRYSTMAITSSFVLLSDLFNTSTRASAPSSESFSRSIFGMVMMVIKKTYHISKKVSIEEH